MLNGVDMLLKKLKNVTIQFKPPNTTSFLQLVDAGIIRNLKFHNRKLLVNFSLNSIKLHLYEGSNLNDQTSLVLSQTRDYRTLLPSYKNYW